MTSRKRTAISLFTGAGGLDYGFEAAGFETRVALEMDAACCASLRQSRSWPVISADLLATDTATLLEVAALAPGEIDVLIGGPPCQPFSKSSWWATGDSRRLDDPRAGTLGGYLRVLREARPRAFVLENVEGLAFDGKDHGLRLLLQTIERINAESGTMYRPTVHRLNAADYGVPQTRVRVFVVGSRDGRQFSTPRPTHSDPAAGLLADDCAPWTTVWDAIGDLDGTNDPSLSVRGKWADLLPSIPEGQNYLWHTDRMDGLPLFGWRRRYWNFLLKLSKARPSWTIQAQPGPATGPFHWRSRKLSIPELSRLQTFPDNVAFSGSYSDVHRQLGNAVPSLLAEVVAREVAMQLLGQRLYRSEPSLLQERRPNVPPPEPIAAVPEKYRHMIGTHKAHPGTGQGPMYQRTRAVVAAE